MFNNYAFQQRDPLNPHHTEAAGAEAQTHEATIQAAPLGGFHESTSPNTIMALCLTPFCIAFLLFAVHFIRYSIRLNRSIKRLGHVAILERALCKTPDECS